MVRLLLAVLAAACLWPMSTSATSAADRPNIVWLTTEDNSANWYRLYDENGATLPHIEWMAENGLVFNNAYSCAPVCSTARSTIISGCYAPRLGAQYHRREIGVELPPGLKPFPAYLRKAGYYTTNNSKTDYNFSGNLQKVAWNESSGKATYRNRKEGQPFFHVQNFGITHEGQLFGGLPKGEELVVAPEETETFPYHPNTDLFREKYAQYLTRQTLADQQMGQFIEQLEKDGLLDDTFIFHYGDHGGVLPGSKGYACNDGLQVAMVVYVPKNWKHLVPAERGSRIDGFVEFVDLSATVLNLAGVEIPEQIDGQPFLGQGVELDELNSRDTAYGYAERFDEKYDLVRFLRKGNFTYHRNYQPFNFDGLYNEYRYKQPAYREWRDLYHAGKLNDQQSQFFEARPAEELYDLTKDPHEVNNLAADQAYANKLAELRGLVQERVTSLPDLGMIPESVFAAESNGNGYAYALENKDRIAELLQTADLQLKSFVAAQSGIENALNADDPLQRYWGLIVCSSFGEEAAPFYEQARTLAKSDADLLVRTRAAEFLALTEQENPQNVLTDVLRQSTDPIEANLILNTVVLLRDAPPGYTFDFSAVEGAAWFKETPGISNHVQRRIEQFRANQPQEILNEDFESSKSIRNWFPTQPDRWEVSPTETEQRNALLLKGVSKNYHPPFRSPFSITLLKDKVLGSFELTAKVKTLQTSRGHRDMCIFWGWQDPSHFYYVHLGEKPDPNSSQIFIVDNNPRTPITDTNAGGIPWEDDTWHDVKLIRDIDSGTIEVYFDDMETPVKTASDKSFRWGLVGLGSFDDLGMWDDVRINGVLVEGNPELPEQNRQGKTINERNQKPR